jgi:uncharacterized protein
MSIPRHAGVSRLTHGPSQNRGAKLMRLLEGKRDTPRAMSEENVERVRGGYEAFARGDVDAVLELLAPDVDWHPAIAAILGVETLRGREAVRRFLSRDLFEGFDRFRADPLSFEDLGDFVLVMVRYTGRGEGSGIELDQRFATLYEIRNGQTVTMRDYPTREEALEAAELS